MYGSNADILVFESIFSCFLFSIFVFGLWVKMGVFLNEKRPFVVL